MWSARLPVKDEKKNHKVRKTHLVRKKLYLGYRYLHGYRITLQHINFFLLSFTG